MWRVIGARIAGMYGPTRPGDDEKEGKLSPRKGYGYPF